MQLTARLSLAALFATTLAACGTAPRQGGDPDAQTLTPLRQCSGTVDGHAVDYRVFDGYVIGCFGGDGCVRSGDQDTTVQYTAFTRGVYQHSWSMEPTSNGRVSVDLWQGGQGAGQATVFIDCDRVSTRF